MKFLGISKKKNGKSGDLPIHIDMVKGVPQSDVFKTKRHHPEERGPPPHTHTTHIRHGFKRKRTKPKVK
jgi:hypothetical protein